MEMTKEWTGTLTASTMLGPVAEAEKAKAELAAARDLLRRIYQGETGGEPMYEDGMFVEWIDKEIAAFIRAWGPFA